LITTLPREAQAVSAAAELLAGADRTVTAADDFLRNPSALKHLKACDSVVLAEKTGRSRHSAIRDALGAANAAGKPVGGYILL